MSRAREHEVSSPISLFPFIGILLCTMGALLVVLVAVSRSARDGAVRDAKAKHEANAAADTGLKKKLDEVSHYMGALASISSKAETHLRDEHARLSHVEDHIRRLQERMRDLQIAARELASLEKEHFDDRAQAEREAARLNQLIDDSRKTIESLQEVADKEPASYALVPYEGPNGTFRRPIYIECVKDEVVLQPEGVHISASDLRTPRGAGNPLAAALRAARDHIVQLHPKEGTSRDTEPYPLIIVRPAGLYMFVRAREAVEAGDFELGFELVEEDWDLKFPQPDPQLAGIEKLAVDQARARQQILAAAAPRAYSGKSNRFNDSPYGSDDDGTDYGGGGGGYGDGGDEDGGGAGGYGGGGDGRYAGGGGYGGGGSSGKGGGYGWPGASATGVGGGGGGNIGGGALAGGPVSAGGPSGGYGPGGASGYRGGGANAGGDPGGGNGFGETGGPGGGGNGGSGGYAAGGAGGNGGGGAYGSGGGGGDEGGAYDGGGAGGAAGGMAGGGTAGGSMSGGCPGGGGGAGGGMSGGGGGMSGGGMATAASTDPNAPPGEAGPQNVSVMMGATPPDASNAAFDSNGPRNRAVPPDQRGKDWALRKNPTRASAVRRTIRVVVKRDQLAILPDGVAKANAPASAKVVPMRGDTVLAVDDFVKEVHNQIDGWGIAGNGLYWRPVIVLSVASDGRGRADDLARLLRNSGLELKNDETANLAPQGATHETR